MHIQRWVPALALACAVLLSAASAHAGPCDDTNPVAGIMPHGSFDMDASAKAEVVGLNSLAGRTVCGTGHFLVGVAEVLKKVADNLHNHAGDSMRRIFGHMSSDEFVARTDPEEFVRTNGIDHYFELAKRKGFRPVMTPADYNRLATISPAKFVRRFGAGAYDTFVHHNHLDIDVTDFVAHNVPEEFLKTYSKDILKDYLRSHPVPGGQYQLAQASAAVYGSESERHVTLRSNVGAPGPAARAGN